MGLLKLCGVKRLNIAVLLLGLNLCLVCEGVTPPLHVHVKEEVLHTKDNGGVYKGCDLLLQDNNPAAVLIEGSSGSADGVSTAAHLREH